MEGISLYHEARHGSWVGVVCMAHVFVRISTGMTNYAKNVGRNVQTRLPIFLGCRAATRAMIWHLKECTHSTYTDWLLSSELSAQIGHDNSFRFIPLLVQHARDLQERITVCIIMDHYIYSIAWRHGSKAPEVLPVMPGNMDFACT